MDPPSPRKRSLPSTFIRAQSRKYRAPVPSRDPNAWRKLLHQSPPKLEKAASKITNPARASTSQITIEDEDGLEVSFRSIYTVPASYSISSHQVRSVKRSRHRATTGASKPEFAIPKDESLIEAMSGFSFLSAGRVMPLQDRSNVLAEVQGLTAKASKAVVSNGNDGQPIHDVIQLEHSAPVIHTSTPPREKDFVDIKMDLSSLDAANLSTIPRFRFFGRSKSDASMDSQASMSDFTFSTTLASARTAVASFIPVLHSERAKSSENALISYVSAPGPPSNSPALPSAGTFTGCNETSSAVDDHFLESLQTRLKVREIPAKSISASTTSFPQGKSMSRRPPLQRRDRYEETATRLSMNVNKMSSKAIKKKKIANGSTYKSGLSAEAKSAGNTKMVTPTNYGRVQKPTITVGMRGTKGSLIRDTPVKADPEASVDELGLSGR
jgi:hypothetical protein